MFIKRVIAQIHGLQAPDIIRPERPLTYKNRVSSFYDFLSSGGIKLENTQFTMSNLTSSDNFPSLDSMPPSYLL
ncbi:hypothetical protein AMTR_s00087p00171080 [Amborella trichopoda]|uniref:Uncharacterized protein n=1 Tax=Amborella trichopoda TaxID=13333 RepID=W1P4U1_AMBTC|nr:hypothetical protein AMTR_s00087p00171080 [Amborella trichopoda]